MPSVTTVRIMSSTWAAASLLHTPRCTGAYRLCVTLWLYSSTMASVNVGER